MNKIKQLLTSETSDKQLYELADKLGLKINNICYINELRYLPAKEGNYILNLKEPAHWIGVLITKYKDKMTGFYFNSFGDLMRIPKEVIQFFRRCKCIEYYDSNKAVQNPNIGHCGQFAMDWLLHMNLNKKNNIIDSYESFLRKLHNTDKEVKRYIERHHLVF